MPIEALQIPDKTWETLRKLAALTGVSDEDTIPKLIQDALRVYQWVLRQQAQSGVVVALKQNDLESLTNNPALAGARASLKQLYADDKADEARAYFSETARWRFLTS